MKYADYSGAAGASAGFGGASAGGAAAGFDGRERVSLTLLMLFYVSAQR